MNFILKLKAKYYSKRVMGILGIMALGFGVIAITLSLKFKPAYKVTLAGETLGFVTDKQEEQSKINEYINSAEGNVAFIDIKELPTYESTLISRAQTTSEDEILEKVKSTAEITYKTYAVIYDGEEKFNVSTEEEANNIIASVKEDLIDGVELEFGINKVYSTELKLENTETAIATLNTIKEEKVQEYEEEQARKAAAAAAAAAASYGGYTSTATLASAGAINGLNLRAPVSGLISSRFGASSSRRSSAHTGLDIATSAGTPFVAAASGTVIFASYSGSYGNLIKISHGNGIETWYAHCSSINVSVGQSVSQGQTIGRVGSTGNSSGPHLHLEIRIGGTPVNPQNYLYN